MNKILTVNDVAKILQVQPITVREMFRDKRLRAFKVGKAWRTTETMLEEDIAAIARGESPSVVPMMGGVEAAPTVATPVATSAAAPEPEKPAEKKRAPRTKKPESPPEVEPTAQDPESATPEPAEQKPETAAKDKKAKDDSQQLLF